MQVTHHMPESFSLRVWLYGSRRLLRLPQALPPGAVISLSKYQKLLR